MSNLITNKLNSLPEQVENNRKNINSIANDYYNKTNAIEIIPCNDMISCYGYQLSENLNSDFKSKTYNFKLITTNFHGIFKIYGSEIKTNADNCIGCVRITGILGGWTKGEGQTNINIMIPVREYNGNFWGTAYGQEKTSTLINKINIIVGLVDNKVQVYLQTNQYYATAYLTIECISNCENLTLENLSSLPTMSNKTSFSEQYALGNIKNLLV